VPRATPEPPPSQSSLQERVNTIEREAILDALNRSGGNKSAAARLLGITRNGLALKMSRLGIS
jgi:DNA-binding NtrC family response regulator